MKPSTIFAQLKVSIARFPKQYAEARARLAALAPYEDASTATEALAATSDSYETRGAIALALVSEQQRAPHPLWQAMLAVAFEPLIRNVIGRVGRDREDLHGRVYFAFLEAIDRVSPSAVPIALVRATKRGVFGEKIPEKSEPTASEFDDEQCVADPLNVATAETLLIAAEATGRTMKGDEAELGEAIAATASGEISLKDYVGERYAALPEAERAARYDRLCRARRRFRARQSDRIAA